MTQNAYKKAGVDIEKADRLIERIKPHIKNTKRCGVVSDIGGFGAFFDLNAAGSYNSPVLVSSTDGVGTKLKLAFESGRHETIGVDCVAMCVNDILVHGAEPLFFLDYFSTGELNDECAESVIKGVAKGCELAGCALIGGETAEMPGMYQAGEYDLAGFSVGVVEKDQIINGKQISPGDEIIGISSDGLHSNGFSLVRHLIHANNIDLFAPPPFTQGETLVDSLLTPTRIYASDLEPFLKDQENRERPLIKGMAHITGGGISGNLKRILPDGCAAVLDCQKWPAHPVFKWLEELGGLSKDDLLQTFNCGLGLILVCSKDDLEVIKSKAGSRTIIYHIGHIEARSGSQPVRIQNIDKLCMGES